eukprot:3695053-Rhodomonas_salina.1
MRGSSYLSCTNQQKAKRQSQTAGWGGSSQLQSSSAEWWLLGNSQRLHLALCDRCCMQPERWNRETAPARWENEHQNHVSAEAERGGTLHALPRPIKTVGLSTKTTR